MQNKKVTYRYRLILLILLSVLCIGNINAQENKADVFWKAYITALEKDNQYMHDLEQKREKERILTYKKQETEKIKACLDKKYSKASVDETLKRIIELNTFMQGQKLKPDTIYLYEKLVKDFERQAKRFIQVCHIDTIADERYGVLVRMDKSALIPTHIKHMLDCIKKKYESNGLSSLKFRPEYKYLNKQLELLNKIFEEIPKMSDAKKMYSRLEELLKIESEISEEHKSYYHIK